jgi:dynein heavy chain
MEVLETGSASPDVWVKPETIGTLPVPRADSPIAYDPTSGTLVLFGGWSNRWLGDLWVCKVRDVVGPPYSIHDIEPKISPVTGGARCVIRGMGLAETNGDAGVSVACFKGTAEAPATVVSDTELVFFTPDFRKFGPQDVQCRVRIGPGGLTNAGVEIKLFEVTSAPETVVFGPGIIDGVAAGDECCIVIQAKDTNGADRWCGMDEFTVQVRASPGTTKHTLPHALH